MKILGVNRLDYPSQDHRAITLIAVLVEGDIGDYACYAGYGEPEWVAEYGDKVSFTHACGHFPGGQLKEELYRL